MSNLIHIFIIIPTNCPICLIGKISIINNDNIINPLLGKCSHYKCRRTLFLRNNTIFSENNYTPASVLYYIMEKWIHEEFNAEKISKFLCEKYKKAKLNKKFIILYIIIYLNLGKI